MAKITLASILTAFASALSLNNRFDDIEEHFNDKVLYRDNPSGEANQMESPIDMNSNRILNLPSPVADQEPARLVDIKDGVSVIVEAIPSPTGNEDKALSSNGSGVVYKKNTFWQDTVTDMLVDTSVVLGQIWECGDYAVGNDAGVLLFKVVPSATGTADSGSYFDHDTLSLQFERIFSDNGRVSLKDFGVKSTETAANNTIAFQAAANYVCNNNGLLINDLITFPSNAITTPDSTTFNFVGKGEGYKTGTSGKTSQIVFTGTASTVSFLINPGDHCHLNIVGHIISTTDATEQWGGIEVDTLGIGNATQNSADGVFYIARNSFHTMGGSALILGGEMYGTIENNVCHSVAQFYALNGQGEVYINNNQIETLTNASFTPGSGNGNAAMYVEKTVTKITNNVLADSSDLRNIYHFNNCGEIGFRDNKSERPGLTAPTKNIVLIENTTVSCHTVDIQHNQFVSTSVVAGSFTGRHIKTIGTAGMIRKFSMKNNTLSYSAVATDANSHVDFTVNKPLVMDVLNDNFREPAAVPAFHLSDGTAFSQSSPLLGLQGTDLQTFTVRSDDFTIDANAGGTQVDFYLGASLLPVLLQDNLLQMFPVSVTVQTSAGPGDTVDFYLSTDSGKADKITVDNSNTQVYKRFGGRTDYVSAPSSTTNNLFVFNYDSGVSASTSVKYSLIFTYAIIQDSEASNGKKFPVDFV